MSGQDYSYCFLRYRQESEAGEFANIGVALWAPQSRFLAFQGTKRYSRLTNFFGNLDRDGYRLLMAHVERRFDALSEHVAQDLFEKYSSNVRDLARQVVPDDDGSLIWSAARGGLTENPSEELSRIYSRFIGRHYEPEDSAKRDDTRVFREVYRKAFTNELVAPKIQEHEIVAPLVSHTFEYAWKNGVWNVYETISFDLAEAESIERKANTWYGRSVHLLGAGEESNLNFLLGKPSLSQHAREYERAKAILKSAPRVKLIEEEQAEEFAADLKKAVLKAA